MKKNPVKELESLAPSEGWEPEAFVDLCDKFREKDPASPAYRVLAGLQEIEWKALADFILSPKAID